jgi:hypothetical protein
MTLQDVFMGNMPVWDAAKAYVTNSPMIGSEGNTWATPEQLTGSDQYAQDVLKNLIQQGRNPRPPARQPQGLSEEEQQALEIRRRIMERMYKQHGGGQ